MQKAESLYCGRRLTGKKGEIRAKKVVSVTMIEKSYASRIQAFLNPCIVEGSRFVSVCTDKGLCVCVCVEERRNGRKAGVSLKHKRYTFEDVHSSIDRGFLVANNRGFEPSWSIRRFLFEHECLSFEFQ